MTGHWSKKKGVISGKEAAARATRAHRQAAMKAAKKGKGPAPMFRAVNSGCLMAIALIPVALIKSLWNGRAG